MAPIAPATPGKGIPPEASRPSRGGLRSCRGRYSPRTDRHAGQGSLVRPWPLTKKTRNPRAFRRRGCRIPTSMQLRSSIPLQGDHDKQEGLRAGLRAPGSLSGRALPPHGDRVTSSGLCPRLQRRDCDGLAPSSLPAPRGDRQRFVESLLQHDGSVKENVRIIQIT
jgi:hypothetical protein